MKTKISIDQVNSQSSLTLFALFALAVMYLGSIRGVMPLGWLSVDCAAPGGRDVAQSCRRCWTVLVAWPARDWRPGMDPGKSPGMHDGAHWVCLCSTTRWAQKRWLSWCKREPLEIQLRWVATAVATIIVIWCSDGHGAYRDYMGGVVHTWTRKHVERSVHKVGQTWFICIITKFIRFCRAFRYEKMSGWRLLFLYL